MERAYDLKGITIGAPAAVNGAIHLSEYDPRWPALYAREAEKLRSALGDRVLLLEHVGSTSVPGLCAKPVIDILLLVADSSDEEAYLPALHAAGYPLRIREPEWFEHRMCRGENPSMNLHIFSPGCKEAHRMLSFRDHLRTDAADRALYAETKRALAAREWQYVQDYADAKSDVVHDILSHIRRKEKNI